MGGLIETLELYIQRAETEELGKEMRPEAKESLKAAAKSVAHGYASLEECLMGIEIYDQAEALYFEEDDVFPLKYISALKAIVLAVEQEQAEADDQAAKKSASTTVTRGRSSNKRPSRRRGKIEKEINTFVKQAEEEELEKEMRKEGVSALKTAATKMAYKMKYFDTEKSKFIVFPSVAALLVRQEIYEEAEKHYFDPEDDYPLKYISALKEVAIAAGGFDEDIEEMETKAVEINSDDDLFSSKQKAKSVKERMSVFETSPVRQGSFGQKSQQQQPKHHPLVSPPHGRRRKVTNHAFNERMYMYKQRDDEKIRNMKKLESMRKLNYKGVENVEKGKVGLVSGQFNDQVKQYEEKFKQDILEIQERKKRLREQKGQIRVRKKWHRTDSVVRDEIQTASRKKKLMASIEAYNPSSENDVWTNFRAKTMDVDHTTYQLPQNLPEPSPQEETLLVEAMQDSVLFHPHREVQETRTALVHAFEKFNIPEGEEFVQGPADNFFYVVKEGSVDFKLNGDVVGSAKEGEHFGELNLLYNDDPTQDQNARRKFNLVAKSDSTLMRLNQAVFREILQVQTKRDEDVKKEYLRKVPFLRNLLFTGETEKSKQTTNRLVSIMNAKSFKKGDKIVPDGADPEDSLFIIKEGKVQLTSDKNEVFHLAAGSYIGKRALIASKGKEPNVRDLEGLADGSLYQIEKDAVNKVLGQNFFSRQFDVAQDKKKLEGFQCIKSVNLDPETMEQIAQNIEDKQFEEGKQILEEGADTEPCLYLVRKGFVTLSTNNGEFKQKVGPGGYFGVEQLLVPKDKSRPAEATEKVLVPAQWSVSVTGDTPCICGVLPLQDVQDVLDGDRDDLVEKFDNKGIDVVLEPDEVDEGAATEDDIGAEEELAVEEEAPIKEEPMEEEVAVEKAEESPKTSSSKKPSKKTSKKSTKKTSKKPSKKTQKRTSNKKKPKIRSAADTPEGKQIIADRLNTREMVRKAVPKLDNLEMISILGDGEFGEVWLVSAAEQNFALKMQLKKDDEIIDAIEREIQVTEELRHPNIVDLVTRYDTKESVYMLLGLVPGGELWEQIYREDEDGNWNSGLTEDTAQFYGLVVADTLCWLHSQKYLYRDLKPENVMIDADGYPILVDFGFSKRFENNLTFTFCGTPNYVAPEMVKNLGHDVGVDHWAFGVLVYEMLSGEHPFFEEGMHQMEVFEAICERKHYPLQTEVSEAATSLIDGLLEKDRTQRLGLLAGKMNDILEHRWFKDINLKDLRSRKITAPYIPDKNITPGK